ncbi:MAG: metalloregulator ArsR/SmtB family transcription factor [Pseudomonadota bacterium]
MSLDSTLNVFRAIGEETRLRIVALLRRGELTVSELTQILCQSQPRVSRHLKILAEAGLVERHREGAWIFYRAVAADQNPAFAAIAGAVDQLNDSTDRILDRDRDRFKQSRDARAAAAADYFKENAADWDRVRGLHIPEADIEARMLTLLGEEKAGVFVDFGTGAGRMLSVFADRYQSGYGFDVSREMLSMARANLEKAKIDNAQVRLGDIFSLPLDSGLADIVCIHQVMHFLAEPEAAVREAARLLAPGGRLIISDFAPHELEFLRTDHAHRRLGFSDTEVAGWCERAGLSVIETAALAPEATSGTKPTGTTSKNAVNDAVLTVKIWLCRAPGNVHKLESPLDADDLKRQER